MSYTAYFRLYEELNDYLPVNKRKTIFSLSLKSPTTVDEAICSLGVPREEVDLVLVNSESVPFDYRIAEGDKISIGYKGSCKWTIHEKNSQRMWSRSCERT
ncbi:MAG: hypothetical protein JRJ45_14075 [Deltaproteobacteria bacterium]|nr:hypothetical protein [Deltaproteobacteria bacterium]